MTIMLVDFLKREGWSTVLLPNGTVNRSPLVFTGKMLKRELEEKLAEADVLASSIKAKLKRHINQTMFDHLETRQFMHEALKVRPTVVYNDKEMAGICIDIIGPFEEKFIKEALDIPHDNQWQLAVTTQREENTREL